MKPEILYLYRKIDIVVDPALFSEKIELFDKNSKDPYNYISQKYADMFLKRVALFEEKHRTRWQVVPKILATSEVLLYKYFKENGKLPLDRDKESVKDMNLDLELTRSRGLFAIIFPENMDQERLSKKDTISLCKYDKESGEVKLVNLSEYNIRSKVAAFYPAKAASRKRYVPTRDPCGVYDQQNEICYTTNEIQSENFAPAKYRASLVKSTIEVFEEQTILLESLEDLDFGD